MNYSTLITALILSWALFLGFLVFSSMLARLGRCPLCRAIKELDQEATRKNRAGLSQKEEGRIMSRGLSRLAESIVVHCPTCGSPMEYRDTWPSHLFHGWYCVVRELQVDNCSGWIACSFPCCQKIVAEPPRQEESDAHREFMKGVDRVLEELGPRDPWIPQIGDRVYATGGNFYGTGTVTGFAKDDPSVPWIKLDSGQSWDARDLGSVRRLKDST
jgi:hypothetical protein